MDRDRNAHLINVAQKFGVNLILIKAGDFLPSVLSCMPTTQHKKGIHLVCGIGGFEEGVLAAVAAKALGAVGEGRGWSPDPEIALKYKQVWTINDLVRGKKADCLVSISSITGDNKWFDLSGVRVVGNGHEVTTLTVLEDGVKIVKKVPH